MVLNLTKNQVSRGWEVEIVTLDRLFWDATRRRLPQNESVESLRVRRIPFYGSIRYPIAPKVLQHLRGDIIHVHAIDFFFDFIALTKSIHRRPLIATTHGGFFHTEFAGRLKLLYFTTVTRFAAACYARVVACSRADATRFARIVPKVVTIENGVDLNKLRGRAAEVHTRTIVSFGRWAVNKRVPALFDLLSELRRISPDWRLIVAGTEVDVTLQDLQDAAEKAGVSGSVRIVKAPSDTALRDLVGEASYFMALSSFEGFGITAIEAMSAGLFPVLSDIPTFRDFVGRAGVGMLVDPRDPARAARLLMEADARERSAPSWKASLMAAAESYDWAAVTTAYLREYESILHEAGRPVR